MKPFFLLLFAFALLLAACTAQVASPSPTGTLPPPPTIVPSATPTLIPSATFTATLKPLSTLTPTLKSSPTQTTTPTSNTTESVHLFLSLIGLHEVGDKYYFHIIVSDPELVPKTIQIFDRIIDHIDGPFDVIEKTDFGFCARYDWLGKNSMRLKESICQI